MIRLLFAPDTAPGVRSYCGAPCGHHDCELARELHAARAMIRRAIDHLAAPATDAEAAWIVAARKLVIP